MLDQGVMAKFRFGGGASDTVLNPVTLCILVIAVALIFSQRRNRIVTFFVLAYFTIPYGQVVVLAGLHFTILQVLILVVIVRVGFFRSRGEAAFPGGFNGVDKVATMWAGLLFVTFTIQWMDMQAVIKGAGDLVMNLGGYVTARFMIVDRATLRRALIAVSAICGIQGMCMLSEQFTSRNIFEAMGANSPSLREGHIRAEGAMGTLQSGAVAGSVIPLFLVLWNDRRSRVAAGIGIAGATTMVWASHASTAWLAYGGSLLGLAFWPCRKIMRYVRWALLATLIGLHLVMHGPVWSLIEKIDVTGGSSSYHRYMLVDNCIRHFSDWWLVGYRYYGNWGFDMWDLCNQFVVAALTGGLASLSCFIATYTRCFAAIGIARKRDNGNRKQEWLFWCVGSSLFAHIVASFGINYINHLLVVFFLLLAVISVATTSKRKNTAGNVPERGGTELKVDVLANSHVVSSR